jgi:glycosyltransferase involved in cell wall biosynthesis
MKALFVYTGSFFIDKNGDVADQNITYNLLLRYKAFFSTIILAGRYSVEKDIVAKKQSLVEGDGVSFVGLIEKKNKYSVMLNKKAICKKIEEQMENVDVVIARVPCEMASWAIQIAKRKGVPVITEVVGCPYDALNNHGSIAGKVYAPISYYKLKKTMSRVENAIYVTGSFLQNRYPSKGNQIGGSDVEIENYDVKNLENRIQKINSRKDDEPIVIGLMGSLDVKYKGHEVALKAVKELKNKGIKTVIRFAGGGNKEKWALLSEKLGIEECVEFSGLLSKGEVKAWLQDIDIYLQPSKQEGLPRAVIEAMSYACPTIGSNIGGTPELLSKDFLINPDDHIGLAKKIISLTSNKQLELEQANKSFQKAGQFNYDKLKLKRDTFFREFINKSVK